MFLKKFMSTTTYDLRKFIAAGYQWFLPFTCILCSMPSKRFYNICHPCQEDLPILPQCCTQCANFLHIHDELDYRTSHSMFEGRDHGWYGALMPGRPFLKTWNGSYGSQGQLICGACLSNPPPFDRTYALFPYEPPIIQLIIQLKFQGKLYVAESLGEMFSQKIKTVWYKQKPLPDLIIPIPLHAKRLRDRGFNQALEIAKPIAKSLRIPIDFTNAIRIKHTKPQSSLTKEEREQNLKHAFRVMKNYTGLHVAVVDDVVTTGYTVTAFCQALKEKGVSSIDVWCQARRG